MPTKWKSLIINLFLTSVSIFAFIKLAQSMYIYPFSNIDGLFFLQEPKEYFFTILKYHPVTIPITLSFLSLIIGLGIYLLTGGERNHILHIASTVCLVYVGITVIYWLFEIFNTGMITWLVIKRNMNFLVFISSLILFFRTRKKRDTNTTIIEKEHIHSQD